METVVNVATVFFCTKKYIILVLVQYMGSWRVDSTASGKSKLLGYLKVLLGGGAIWKVRLDLDKLVILYTVLLGLMTLYNTAHDFLKNHADGLVEKHLKKFLGKIKSYLKR